MKYVIYDKLTSRYLMDEQQGVFDYAINIATQFDELEAAEYWVEMTYLNYGPELELCIQPIMVEVRCAGAPTIIPRPWEGKVAIRIHRPYGCGYAYYRAVYPDEVAVSHNVLGATFFTNGDCANAMIEKHLKGHPDCQTVREFTVVRIEDIL